MYWQWSYSWDDIIVLLKTAICLLLNKKSMGDNITTSLAFIYMYFNVFPPKFFLNSKGVND